MKKTSQLWSTLISGFLALAIALIGIPQAEAQNRTNFDDKLHEAVEYRLVGPHRGGRSAAVTGVPGKPLLFYMGATGGGVWRTTNGGQTWENISDGYFGGSIGAVAVSEFDNNVIYVGGGEKTVRGNVSYGYGMWKSIDAGKTWEFIGLPESRHISRIRIHPRNPDHVYVAVMGDLMKDTSERGVYESKDGGKTWNKILFASNRAGAVDLVMEPGNPRVLYATTWDIRRTPYSLESGGPDSKMWKTTDGGANWTDITSNPGLPRGAWGIAGITVSPVNTDRVYAIIENDNGGVYRSDDAGATWRMMNNQRDKRQRAWYYTRLYADTQDADKLWVLNVNYHISNDGGRTFRSANAPHGDHHDLWIAPEDPNRVIIADDGGAQISYDGGDTWSTYMNQPTAQFYRVTTDNHFPYRIYVAQQDNSTMRIAHRNDGGGISENDWQSSAGGESGWLAPDPKNNDIVYGGSYGGLLTRLDHSTDQSRAVNVWPDNPMGWGAEGMKYRFQWNFPIVFSKHDDNKLITTSQHVHISYNEGQSWQIISPDLTRNDPTKLGPSGGPITKDNTSVEYYATIFAVAESNFTENVFWTGSDDGLIHVTKDNGKTWENVTPPASIMPEWTQINSMEAHPFEEGGAYVAATSYKNGDYRPYLYKTTDYGKTWKKITNGIDPSHFTRVIRADPKRKGLLYAGTETGMYVSFDDGENWRSFQKNLPIVPITDLAIKDDNLIVATQGRSVWIIDDLTPLHQLSAEVAQAKSHLFKPQDSYRMTGFSRESLTAGTNRPGGVMVYFNMNDVPDNAVVSLEFLENNGNLIRKYATNSSDNSTRLRTKKGGNMFVWDMRYEAAEGFDGMILWAAGLTGPLAVPGDYKVRLTVDGQAQEQTFKILGDPRVETTQEGYKQQFDFLISVRDKLTEAHQSIKQIRDVRTQLNFITSRVKDDPAFADVIAAAKELDKEMTLVEEALYQTKNQSGQDPLNYPIRLNNKLAHLNSLVGRGNYPPTEQSETVRSELTEAINQELSTLRKIIQNDLPQFNRMVRDKNLNAIITGTPTQR